MLKDSFSRFYYSVTIIGFRTTVDFDLVFSYRKFVFLDRSSWMRTALSPLVERPEYLLVAVTRRLNNLKRKGYSGVPQEVRRFQVQKCNDYR